MNRNAHRVAAIAVVLMLVTPALAPPAFAADPAILLTFESDEVGKPPQGWISKGGDPAKVYSVRAEEGKRYVRASSERSVVALGYEKAWPLKDFPILQWQWRAVVFPENTDERKKGGADSVLGIYTVFGHWPFMKTIKYIWSDTIPEGETFDSPHAFHTKIIVVRSGRDRAGEWITERRDVLADYARFFKEKRPPVARGIAIMTDSDSTRTRAVGDYADIRTLER